jgi:hypothetical protein
VSHSMSIKGQGHDIPHTQSTESDAHTRRSVTSPGCPAASDWRGTCPLCSGQQKGYGLRRATQREYRQGTLYLAALRLLVGARVAALHVLGKRYSVPRREYSVPQREYSEPRRAQFQVTWLPCGFLLARASPLCRCSAPYTRSAHSSASARASSLRLGLSVRM